MIHNKYLEVLERFSSLYSKEIYGRELIGKVCFSQKAISLILNDLEDSGILSSSSRGQTKYYSWNLMNPLINKYISFVEQWKAISFFEKHQKFIDLFSELDFELIVVFGSYAKGDYTKSSDLDLFIVGKMDKSKLTELENKYGIKIQVFEVSSKAFESYFSKLSGLNKEILENHIVVFGQDKFVGGVLKCLK
jgi:predicted nucleotidyltransferase